jgi:type I restriction enzyme S subunit
MSVDLTECRFLDEFNGPVQDYYIENGDLLFTRYNGSVDLLGVAGMVRNCTGNVLHPDKLIRVKLAIPHPLSSFVEIAANVGLSRQHMVGRARTTAGQTGISGADIRQMPIPLAPVQEQSIVIDEVTERLTVIERMEQAVVKGLVRSSRLRQSILKRAFEGKLVPQDPTDEPATLLVGRTASEDTEASVQQSKRKTSHNGKKRKAAGR